MKAYENHICYANRHGSCSNGPINDGTNTHKYSLNSAQHSSFIHWPIPMVQSVHIRTTHTHKYSLQLIFPNVLVSVCHFSHSKAPFHDEKLRQEQKKNEKKKKKFSPQKCRIEFLLGHEWSSSVYVCGFVWFCAKWPKKPRTDTRTQTLIPMVHSSASLMDAPHAHSIYSHDSVGQPASKQQHHILAIVRCTRISQIDSHSFRLSKHQTRTHTYASRLRLRLNTPNAACRPRKSGSVAYSHINALRSWRVVMRSRPC